jgi:hypothetical protein
MTTPMVDNELRPLMPQDATVAAQAHPQDVVRFREVLAQDTSRSPGRGNDAESSVDGAAPVSEGTTWELVPAGEVRRFATPVAVPSSAPAGRKPTPTVTGVRRARLQTHAARNGAMQPLTDLLVGVHQRAAGRTVLDMKIVPPEPNPLRLTLRLSMDDGAFVVKVHTGLGPDHREEVKQALQVLQTSLTARLSMPARVVLLA